MDETDSCGNKKNVSAPGEISVEMPGVAFTAVSCAPVLLDGDTAVKCENEDDRVAAEVVRALPEVESTENATENAIESRPRNGRTKTDGCMDLGDKVSKLPVAKEDLSRLAETSVPVKMENMQAVDSSMQLKSGIPKKRKCDTPESASHRKLLKVADDVMETYPVPFRDDKKNGSSNNKNETLQVMSLAAAAASDIFDIVRNHHKDSYELGCLKSKTVDESKHEKVAGAETYSALKVADSSLPGSQASVSLNGEDLLCHSSTTSTHLNNNDLSSPGVRPLDNLDKIIDSVVSSSDPDNLWKPDNLTNGCTSALSLSNANLQKYFVTENHDKKKTQRKSQTAEQLNFNWSTLFKNCVKDDGTVDYHLMPEELKPPKLDEPLYLVPLNLGWRRQVVYRATSVKKTMDIYYLSPKGVKLRSNVKVNEHLLLIGELFLTVANFTYRSCIVGDPHPNETIRLAHPSHKCLKLIGTNGNGTMGNGSSNKKFNVKKFNVDKTAPLPANEFQTQKATSAKIKHKKRTVDTMQTAPPSNKLLPQKSLSSKTPSCKVVTSAKPVKKRSDKMEPIPLNRLARPVSPPRLMLDSDSDSDSSCGRVTEITGGSGGGDVIDLTFSDDEPTNDAVDDVAGVVQDGRLTTMVSAARKSGLTKLRALSGENDCNNVRPCSGSCPGLSGVVPSLLCNACLCLFHPACVGLDNDTHIQEFVCKPCGGPDYTMRAREGNPQDIATLPSKEVLPCPPPLTILPDSLGQVSLPPLTVSGPAFNVGSPFSHIGGGIGTALPGHPMPQLTARPDKPQTPTQLSGAMLISLKRKDGKRIFMVQKAPSSVQTPHPTLPTLKERPSGPLNRPLILGGLPSAPALQARPVLAAPTIQLRAQLPPLQRAPIAPLFIQYHYGANLPKLTPAPTLTSLSSDRNVLTPSPRTTPILSTGRCQTTPSGTPLKRSSAAPTPLPNSLRFILPSLSGNSGAPVPSKMSSLRPEMVQPVIPKTVSDVCQQNLRAGSVVQMPSTAATTTTTTTTSYSNVWTLSVSSASSDVTVTASKTHNVLPQFTASHILSSMAKRAEGVAKDSMSRRTIKLKTGSLEPVRQGLIQSKNSQAPSATSVVAANVVDKPLSQQATLKVRVMTVKDRKACLNAVFQHLTCADLIRASRVCRMWRSVVAELSWERVCLKKLKVLDWDKFAAVLQKNNTKCLDLRGMTMHVDRNRTWHEFAAALPQLKMIRRLLMCEVPQPVVHTVTDALTNLESFVAEAIVESAKDHVNVILRRPRAVPWTIEKISILDRYKMIDGGSA